MIVTAQLFFNELDLLELNCRTLKGVVDAHLIVEARTTFTGQPKPLYFAENRERFRDYLIIHQVVDLQSNAESAWHREGESHRHLLDLVKNVDPEIVIWSDADELARPNIVERFLDLGKPCATLDLDHLIFFFDRIRPDIRDLNPKIGYFDRDCRHQPWRGQTEFPVMIDAGWHFEYMGARQGLLDKLAAISHAPEEGCRLMRAAVQRGEFPGMENTEHYPRNRLPTYVQANPHLFPFFK